MTELQERLKSIHFGALIAPVIALGKKLRLFEALAECGTEERPAEAREVAERARCKERYVVEWLSALACARLIHVTPDDRFWMSDEAKHEFSELNNFEVARMLFVPASIKIFDDLVDAFRLEGRLGLDYAQFADFYNEQDVQTRAKHEKHLVSEYFPLIGLDAQLAGDSRRVLDVGCGSGFHTIKMAETFGHAEVHGVDISERAIEIAEAAADEARLSNITFYVVDAGSMPSDWSDSFDAVTIFDACHDQLRPDLCLNEVYRVLKPGGVFAMLEMRGTSSAFDDASSLSHAAHVYASSLFHCLPVASNRADALCMGAMWGEKRARRLLEQAGFSSDNVQVLHPSFFPINDVYLCKK
ncbi:hypothetical protein PFISCL1PPCAC_13054 [Pristionchus fissidentatus]|uniref:Methyltransferase domain-containing protein n=1 Tax=Pristionchus fissidentatus TaxID=1538716 RepID=A0AAV5VPZ0_9BILA|nr:hypothetical protein PFISCL1PPCAC_13054 [Pristionchus fissidentatus]